MTTELACQTIAMGALSTAGSGSVNVYTGVGNVEDITAPCVICVANDKSEDFPFSGIWHVKTTIFIKEMAADVSVGEMNTLAGLVENAFLFKGIEAALSSATPNYYVYQVVSEGGNAPQRNGDAWVNSFNMDIVCTTL